jgi:hypothetical protein
MVDAVQLAFEWTSTLMMSLSVVDYHTSIECGCMGSSSVIQAC